MITLEELFQHLELFLPSQGISDACPNGLQVEGKPKISKIVVAVSASLAAIKEAVSRKADALIVHHGIFWNKDSFPILGPKKEKLSLLLGNEISLFAYHLPLDAHPDVGNNWKAALDLGWRNLQPFGFFNGTAIGVKGTFPSIEVESFTKTLEKYYGHNAFVALGGKKRVESAALISGGAHRSIEEAAKEGADCFITGSFDEPIWDIAFERKINFFALGHYATERIGAIALCESLKKRFSIPCEFIDLHNPF
jgi:dinuclear metal center YbgI/SA1388 family protein